MQVKVTYAEIIRIATPMFLGSLVQTALIVTDTAFLARVGEVELGAAAVGGLFYFAFTTIGLALSIGSQIIIARKAGEGDTQAIGQIFNHSLILLLALSSLVFFTIYAISSGLYTQLIASSDVREASVEFINYRIWGLWGALPVMAARAFFIGISQTRVLTYASIITFLINIIASYVLILGNWGMPALGVKGAAIANVLSEVVSVIYIFFVLISSKNIRKYHLFRWGRLNWVDVSTILRISYPIALQNFVSAAGWFLFFVFIEKLGEHELAISNVIRSTHVLMMTPMWGLSNVTNTMVSNLIGQGRYGDIQKLIRKIITASLILYVPLLILFALFPSILLGFSSSGTQFVDDSLGCYYIICLATFVLCISMNLLNAVAGYGATKAALSIEVFNIFLYIFYIYFCTIIVKTTLETVWFAEVIYWLVMGILSFLYLEYKIGSRTPAITDCPA